MSGRGAHHIEHASDLVVLGAGAIGSLTAAYLERAGTPLILVDPWFKNVETIRERGIQVTRIEDQLTSRPRTLHVDELSRLDRPIKVVILALKSYDTEWATRLVAPYLAHDAVFLSAQNGMNEPNVTEIVGASRVIGCVVAMSGYLDDAGCVTGTTRRENEAFVIGELDGSQSSRVHGLSTLLSPIGRVTVTDGIWAALWSKLLLNVMLNALAGLSGWTTPSIWSDRRMVRMMVRLGGEACLVADAIGQEVGDLTPPGMPPGLSISPDRLKAAHAGDHRAFEEVTACFGAMAAGRAGGEEGKASLLQDLLRGRRTEVDYLNGYISAQATNWDIPTPANDAVAHLVHAAQMVGPPPSWRSVDELLKAFSEPDTPTDGHGPAL